jgi:thioredoxin reductase
MKDEAMDSYDVVVIGGGAAGLNGALMLARSRRSVVVIDAGAPRNAPADGVHGLLGHDGIPPAELMGRGRAEVIATAVMSWTARSWPPSATATRSG